jgi:hypothetical protein
MKTPMKLVRAIALTLVAAGISTSGRAQDGTKEANYRPFQVGIEAGTTGLGGYGGWRFADHFGARAGFDYLKYTRSGNIEGVAYRGDLRLSSEPLLLDYFPWKNRSFRVSLGVAFNQNELKGTASPTAGTMVTIGTTTVVAGPGDRVDLRIRQQAVAPYLSIGGNLLYFDKAHRWALAGELGVMYTGRSKVDLTTTSGLITAADLATERAEIKRYADRVQFWPVLKLGVNFHF